MCMMGTKKDSIRSAIVWLVTGELYAAAGTRIGGKNPTVPKVSQGQKDVLTWTCQSRLAGTRKAGYTSLPRMAVLRIHYFVSLFAASCSLTRFVCASKSPENHNAIISG